MNKERGYIEALGEFEIWKHHGFQHDCYVPSEKSIGTLMEAAKFRISKNKHYYQGVRCVCGTTVGVNQLYCECCGQKLHPFDKEKLLRIEKRKFLK